MRKIAWFIGIWIAGVVVLTVVAFAIRSVIFM